MTADPTQPGTQNKHDYGEVMFKAMTSRQSVSPKRLSEPGPSPQQLEKLVEVAGCAPHHGLLRPWRFVLFEKEARPKLADVFEAALLERCPDADEEDRHRAREKAARGPLLLGVIVTVDQSDEKVAFEDQIASAGAALQNVLLQAHAFGYAAKATSGRAVRTQAFRTAIGLEKDETFLCFLAIGTAIQSSRTKLRPNAQSLLTNWNGLAGG